MGNKDETRQQRSDRPKAEKALLNIRSVFRYILGKVARNAPNRQVFPSLAVEWQVLIYKLSY